MPHNRLALFQEETENFREALDRFRYEVSRDAKGPRGMRRSARRFGSRLEGFLNYEEKRLFPFLVVHIPRLQPLIRTLRAEHQDFRALAQELARDLAALEGGGEKQPLLLKKIRNESAHLFGLLRSHLWAKRRNIYKPIRRELKPYEKKLLARVRSA